MTKIITLLFIALLFTGCVERGSNLTPKPVSQKPIQKSMPKTPQKTSISAIHTVHPTQKIKQEKHLSQSTITHVIVQERKKTTITPSVKHTTKHNDGFTFSNETKKKISGFFIFLIGLMIFI